ncbi:rhomboid family intramembrane serine protease [Mesorhizobium sp. BAC0120]|uniref:rhomboid family intramembrane serine protease n=1 Tax=Mesorhizobium sp. BAC0120 TaxID=3090670 RepID=UPI00298CFA98|nr:rhomboid family intramembrane serine protease [Mesorhizobium sp. BAC0120]MDW6022719.1 rhomboid family intramembrane serine protease [Mesorhizobium sp. BAC0120]
MSESHSSRSDESRDQENAPREPVFNLPPVVLCLIGICVIVYVADAYFLSERGYLLLMANAAFIPARYSGQLDLDIAAFTWPFTVLTSPLTYAFLHGSVAHLAVNMIWLAAFGSPLANRLRTTRFLLFWALTSISAVALHFVLHWHDQSPVVGASGAISGMMGAAARFGFKIDRSHGKAAFHGAVLPVAACLRSRGVVTFLAIWMLINLATGMISFAPGIEGQIAWEAHIGGFLAGFFGINWIDRPEEENIPPLDPPDQAAEPDGQDRPS